MEYRIEGMIRFHPTRKLKLNETLDFTSPYGARVTLNSTDDNDLSVKMTLDEDSGTEAKQLAEIELDRICNLLSYFYKLRIFKSKIAAVRSEQLTPKGKAIRLDVFLSKTETVESRVEELEQKSIQELGHRLHKPYSPDFQNAISMWKQAISAEVPALQYLLLYRLMEFLFKNDTKAFTDWVKAKEPSVQMFHDRERGDHTIYTDLRDNIHLKGKGKPFPSTQIKDALPSFTSLVKQAIEEKFEIGRAHV